MHDAALPDALAETMARVLPALTAARAAHEAVVDASIDLIALTQRGHRDHTLRQLTRQFDAAVVALGLAALEHLPVGWDWADRPQFAEQALAGTVADAAPPAAGFTGDEAMSETAPRAAAHVPEAHVPAAVAPAAEEEDVARPRTTSDAPIDLRHLWSDLDEDSVVDWPLADPGPVGSGRSMRLSNPPLPPEHIEALKVHLETGGGALAVEVTPVAPSPQAAAISALRKLGSAPASIDAMEEMSKEYARLQSCADPARLEALGLLPGLTCALIAEYLNARLHRIWREVPHRLRPHHILGENAWRTLQKGIDRFHQAQRRRVPRVEPLKLAPRQRTWLDDALVLEPRVQAAIEAAEARSVAPKGSTEASSSLPSLAARQAADGSLAFVRRPPEPALGHHAVSRLLATPFNAERGLDAVERALGDDAPVGVLAPLVTALLKGGVTADDKRLNALLADRIEEFSSSAFKTLRAKTRRFVRDREPDVDEGAEVWPEAAALEGKRVVLVGGDRQSLALERLRVRLPGVEVEWVETSPGGGVRQVQAARTRIGQGSVDVLLLIQRFISHKVSDCLVDEQKTCGHNVRLEVVRRGYGLAQIRRALQSCLVSR